MGTGTGSAGRYKLHVFMPRAIPVQGLSLYVPMLPSIGGAQPTDHSAVNAARARCRRVSPIKERAPHPGSSAPLDPMYGWRKASSGVQVRPLQ